jgi:structure-specific recognition protein 1
MQSKIHKHVLSFLKNNNADKTLVAQWNSKENNEKLKVLVNTDKTKKVKPEKDPEKPSKNKTSYMFFCQDNRVAVLDSGKKGPEVFTELGKRWKECDPKKKTDYEKKATEDKKRYADAMEIYKTKTSS